MIIASSVALSNASAAKHFIVSFFRVNCVQIQTYEAVPMVVSLLLHV